MRKLFGKKLISMLHYTVVLVLSLSIIFFCLVFKHTQVESKHPDKHITIIVESGQTLWGLRQSLEMRVRILGKWYMK